MSDPAQTPAPRHHGDGKTSPILRGLARFQAGWTLFAAAVWVVFLGGFTPLALLNGMVGGAAICAGLGLFAWLFAVRHWARAGRRWRYLVSWGLAIEQLTLLILAIVLLARPPEAWRCLEQTSWSNTVLLHKAGVLRRQGWLFAHAGGPEDGFVRVRRVGAKDAADGPWRDLGYPGPAGWSLALEPVLQIHGLGRLWVAPRGHPELFYARLDAQAKRSGRWRSMARPAGWLRRVALTRRNVFVVVRNRLFAAKREGRSRWRRIRCAGLKTKDNPTATGRRAGLCTDVGVAPLPGGQELVLAVGARWLQSVDGGQRFADVTPPGDRPRLPKTTVAGGGWRYVYDGGFWGGTLFVAPPGKRFEPRELPLRDARVIVADPRHAFGSRAMLASWGEGVWLTEDGGRSWSNLGLRNIQVRSVVVDWPRRRVWAASANMHFHRGIYTRTF
jgi:hypothetical protein